MDLLAELLDVVDAESHGCLQRTGEGCVEGPAGAGGQRRVLPAIGDDDVARIAAVAEGVKGEPVRPAIARSEEHTSELQSLMRISYAVFCLKKKKQYHIILTI